MMMVGLLSLFGASALAHPAVAAAPGKRIERRLDQLVGELRLDARQADSFRATFAKYRAQLAPLRQDALQTRRALRGALAAPQPDDRRVAQLTDQLASDRRQMRDVESQRMSDLKEQLTPTQYARLVLERHEARMGRAARRMP
jgi:Spy/CpxP family protein refolding chaperone